MNPATLDALQAFPALLRTHYAAIPPGFEHWAPPSWEGVPSEPFTALEQVCHVHDIEVEGYQVRLHRTLHEDHPTLASIDSEAVARERQYGRADAAAVLDAFTAARERTLALLRSLDAAQLRRTAEFEGYGPLTLRSLVHYLCSHDQQHLAGLQWLLGKIEAQREPPSAR
jgi:hypothetical protein